MFDMVLITSLGTKMSQTFLSYVTLCAIWHLCNLENMKNICSSDTLSKVEGSNLQLCLKYLLHGCFSRFLNCTDGAQSRKASYQVYFIDASLPTSFGCSDGRSSEIAYSAFDDSNTCYKLYREPKTIQDAQKTCKSDNGTLVKIGST